MKTLLACALCALATPAIAGPDFTLPSPRAKALAASPASSEIGPLDDVTFPTDSTVISDAGVGQIASAVHWLKLHRDHRIVLEGYADSIGDAVYNEDLAMRRAFVVRQHLIGNGIAPDRIVMVVYGELSAIGGAHPLDRRVVMYATKLPPQKIAARSFDRKHALSASWTQGKALFTETRTYRDRERTIIGTR